MPYNVELDTEQSDKITREVLIDMLEDLNIPFTDPNMVECVNRLIAWMSPPGTWQDGKYDDYS